MAVETPTPTAQAIAAAVEALEPVSKERERLARRSSYPDASIVVRPTLTWGELCTATKALTQLRALKLEPDEEDADAIGAAERDVGRYVYRRIETLMDARAATPEASELVYLATIAETVEEYGADSCDGHPLAALQPEQRAQGREIADILVMTGCRDREDLEDMARVGKSLLDAIAEVHRCEGPFKGWAPAEDPAEIVVDLLNALDEALTAHPEQPGGVPEGWRLVPSTATPELLAAVVQNVADPSPEDNVIAIRARALLPTSGNPVRMILAEMARDYRELIAAAPSPPARSGQDG